jgi:hypothetical protein
MPQLNRLSDEVLEYIAHILAGIKTGSEITEFFRVAGFPEIRHDGSTKWRFVYGALQRLNEESPYHVIKVIEKLADPKQYIGQESLHREAVGDLKKALKYEDITINEKNKVVLLQSPKIKEEVRKVKEINKEKIEERWVLLSRFFSGKLYEIGKFLDISWFIQFDEDFEFAGCVPLYGDNEKEALNLIVNSISDKKLEEVFERFEPNLWNIESFLGKYYTFVNEKFRIGSKHNEVRKDVLKALSDTGERGYAFLNAIISLYEEGKCDSVYGGAKFSDIVAKMREITGKSIMPSPMDYVLFNSYKIYYKTGSNKYPTHTIPPESIPAVKQALEEFKSAERKGAVSEAAKITVKTKPKIIRCPLTGSKCEKYIETQPNMYFVAHAFTKENKDGLRGAIEKALKDFYLEPYYADQEIRSQHILCKICEKIRCSKFGIFDISDGNSNVTLELGMAWGFGSKALLITKSGSKIPADLEGLDRLEYKSFKDLTEKLRTKIGDYT